MGTIQLICIFIVFAGALVVAGTNLVAANVNRDSFGWRGWVSKKASWISFITAMAIAGGLAGNQLAATEISRSSAESHGRDLQELKSQIDTLGKDNELMRNDIAPVVDYAKKSGISIEQAIDRLLVSKAAEDEETRHSEAVIGISDFRRMLMREDLLFHKSFDSLANNMRAHGLGEQGVYLSRLIEFAEDYRRRRDAAIDSCLVRFRQLGVDTDSLRFSKKLPFRVGQSLKGHAKRLDQGQGDIVRHVLQCDSL